MRWRWGLVQMELLPPTTTTKAQEQQLLARPICGYPRGLTVAMVTLFGGIRSLGRAEVLS
jgi:hypothetical protein